MPFPSSSPRAAHARRRPVVVVAATLVAGAVATLGYAARAQQAATSVSVDQPAAIETAKLITDADGNTTLQTMHSNGMIVSETNVPSDPNTPNGARRLVRQTITGTGWIINDAFKFDKTGKEKVIGSQLITGSGWILTNEPRYGKNGKWKTNRSSLVMANGVLEDNGAYTGYPNGVRIAPNGAITRPDGITVRPDGAIVNRQGKVLVPVLPALKKP